ncbi:hypothetical protein HK096_009537 [Nowakowskiella sp. JEL0078]|nr:hypothetical protein HK096_009537 [Nowakowskiella sp. JEL0078]
MSNIDCSTMTTGEVFNIHKALGYRVSDYIDNKKLQFLELVDPKETSFNREDVTGSLHFDKSSNYVYIRCSDGWIGCKKFKVQDKKVVSAKDFANGYNLKKIVLLNPKQ